MPIKSYEAENVYFCVRYGVLFGLVGGRILVYWKESTFCTHCFRFWGGGGSRQADACDFIILRQQTVMVRFNHRFY